MMNFNEFCGAIKGIIESRLPEEYFGSTIETYEVVKNGGTVTGINIRKAGSNVCPTIYLESFYEAYMNGKDLAEIAEQIIAIRIEHDTEIDTDVIGSLDYIKEHVYPRLVAAGNHSFLNGKAYSLVADDLAVVYSVKVYIDGSDGSYVIQEGQLDTLGISLSELHKIALDNIQTVMGPSVYWMHEMLINILREQGANDEQIQAMLPELPPDMQDQTILTSENKTFGASVILSREIMDSVLKRYDAEKVYILPSSIHECICLPEGTGSVDELSQMVTSINATQVDPMDKLTDAVYSYTSEDGLVKVA